jgi:hypothetical protein
MPRAVKYLPQLATLVDAPPSGDDWLHEIKFDGYRIGCAIAGGRVTLISRNVKDWTSVFPEIVDAAKRLPVSEALLDGEVAILLPDGRTSFQALQNALSGSGARSNLVYFVFDLLQRDGKSLQGLSLEARKAELGALIRTRTAGHRCRPHRRKRQSLDRHARSPQALCRNGAMRRTTRSSPGWLKTKVRNDRNSWSAASPIRKARAGLGPCSAATTTAWSFPGRGTDSRSSGATSGAI